MVDAADEDKIEASRNELHNLLEKPQESSRINIIALTFSTEPGTIVI